MGNFRNIKIDSIMDNVDKVRMDLVGLDGNAFSLMGHFSAKANRQGWDADDIKYVIEECMDGDYDHLLCTLLKFTTTDKEDPEVIYHNGNAYRKV